MSRYFFNVHDGVSISDNVGSELADLGEAQLEAQRVAGDFLRNGGKADLWSGHEWQLVVTDEAGRKVLTLRFSGSLADPA